MAEHDGGHGADADAGAVAGAQGYLNAGGLCPNRTSPVGKIMLAVGPDSLHFDSTGVTLHGRHVNMTRPRATDRIGRPVRHAPYGTYHLPPGAAWLWSPYVSFSWDSRYFGPVGPAGFRELVVPVVTDGARPLLGP